jgi:acyl carrier protein
MMPDCRLIPLPWKGLRGQKPPFHGKPEEQMTDRQPIFDSVAALIAPFNKKEAALTDATTFAGDLEWDSLTVMDFVAAVEDEFDIIITMNMQAEIETVGQLVDAVGKLKAA